MTDASVLSATALRRDFSARAKPPTEALEKATAFIDTLEQKLREGQTITQEERVRGERLTKQLDLQTEQFSYWGAVTAGQFSPTKAIMQGRLEDISRTYDRTKAMVGLLQETLKKL
jgi:hypothetical protein